jgi:uncharacterized protein
VICKQAERAKSSLENQGCRTVEEIDAELEEDRRLAELGGAKSQYNVGDLYFTGVDVAVDKTDEVKWHRLAAPQGYADAQYNLGNADSYGKGVYVYHVESVKW